MAIEASSEAAGRRRIRLGMVGGGQGAFIGAVHRIAARLDDQFELVAGALSSDPERARTSGAALGLDPTRCYDSYAAMFAAERVQVSCESEGTRILRRNWGVSAPDSEQMWGDPVPRSPHQAHPRASKGPK